jgi:phosphatidylglycerol:prolipoprotein diacylglycerol transferase
MSPYLILMLAGIGFSSWLWARTYRKDPVLLLIYISGLLIAFLGAKIAYLAAEGWMHWGADDFWVQAATGKSALGALLGGYLGVELAKSVLGRTLITGDFFAGTVPLGVAMGRVGCWLQGCCLGRECPANWFTVSDHFGITRWPSPQVELLFNLCMLGLFCCWRRRKFLPGQHFHIYLISYGLFRFAHEFARETPHVFGGFSGYQIIAAGMAVFGAAAFARRWRSSTALEHARTGGNAGLSLSCALKTEDASSTLRESTG